MNAQAAAPSVRLGDADRHHYQEQGYLIPDYRLPDALLGSLRGACDRLIAADPGTRPEHLMNPHLVSWPGGRNPFMEVARHGAVLDMVEQLIGPDLILMRGSDRSGRNDFEHGHREWVERLSTLSL